MYNIGTTAWNTRMSDSLPKIDFNLHKMLGNVTPTYVLDAQNPSPERMIYTS